MAKILVVDDSQLVRTQLRKALEEVKHQVVEAENGKIGFEAWKANPDLKLIICDVNMPEVDGIGMLTLLSEAKPANLCPIIMLTTESKNELKEKGRALGVRAWMIKPFTPDKLLAVLEKLKI
ncbi:MAG: response regulator [Bdellovibrionaceae bacterium]|nr:response regulator [Pseudobdellovibrionaceae bacterium]